MIYFRSTSCTFFLGSREFFNIIPNSCVSRRSCPAVNRDEKGHFRTSKEGTVKGTGHGFLGIGHSSEPRVDELFVSVVDVEAIY